MGVWKAVVIAWKFYRVMRRFKNARLRSAPEART
jgi:hypothetical protein